MCFQTIKYECGHQEKDLLSCRNRSGLRGLFQSLLDFLCPNDKPLGCDKIAHAYVRRAHDCQRCLTQRIPDLRRRERRSLGVLRGEFTADDRVEPKKSVPSRARPKQVPISSPFAQIYLVFSFCLQLTE